jgi:3-deoxy-7-phosphoheptulonate synthase
MNNINHIHTARTTIQNILKKQDGRFLVIVGPCSAHNPAVDLAYAEKLSLLSHELADKIFVVMRLPGEKPRTVIGGAGNWKGMALDPDMDGSYNISKGIQTYRNLLQDITERYQLPLATEFLYPELRHHWEHLISLGWIGSRNCGCQVHRELASDLAMPVGFKNPLSGNISTAINSIISAQSGHITPNYISRGNEHGFVILRGSDAGKNYESEHLQNLSEMYVKHNLPVRRAIVDVAHGNCINEKGKKDPLLQIGGALAVIQEHHRNPSIIAGVMIESSLEDGNATSKTDPCVGWEKTEKLLTDMYAQF